MKLNGEQKIKAQRDLVFAALNDPEVLQNSIPGCKSLTRLSTTELEAEVGLKVGPVKATFKGNVVISDLNPPESYTITGEGKGGTAGHAKGRVDVTLRADQDETILSYTVDAQVGGKLAQLGSRLIDSTANKLSAQFFTKFSKYVENQSEPPAEECPAIGEPAEKPGMWRRLKNSLGTG